MGIWKKSEDPWDRKPGRDWLNKPKEPKESPIDGLKAWNEKRKADIEAARRRPPEKCPWCGTDMEQGYLANGRSLWWAPGIPNFMSKWVSVEYAEGAFQVDSDGGLCPYKLTWFCRECEKMVFDTAKAKELPLRVSPEPEGKSEKSPDTSEEE